MADKKKKGNNKKRMLPTDQNQGNPKAKKRQH